MQYILTEEEYEDLTNRAAFGDHFPSVAMLQKVCTRIANEMPIMVKSWPSRGFIPWGCAIDELDWVCDHCPVIDICPYESKHFSK